MRVNARLLILLVVALTLGMPPAQAVAKADPQPLATKTLTAKAPPAHLSPAGAKFISSFEGVYTRCYRDPVGILTIGIGHVGCSPGQTITLDRAYELLQQDAELAAGAVRSGVHVPLNQNQVDALISFAFNVGNGGFLGSTALKELNAGHYKAVPAQLSRWVYGGGQILPGLVRRRAAEGDLFLADVPKALRKLTTSQARTVQAAEKTGTNVKALRGFIAYFQQQIDRTKTTLDEGNVDAQGRAILEERIKVLRREKDQARARIGKSLADQETVEGAVLNTLQPAAPAKADTPKAPERDGLEKTKAPKVAPQAAKPLATYANGRIPKSALSPIFNARGPPVYLAAAPAAAWNTMALLAADRSDLATPRVNGPDSAYRTYDRQVYWRNYWCGHGNCANAAVPGTSNHGLAIAVDVPGDVQALIRSIGNQFGWNHNCSDAPWEAWHHKWCGGYDRPDPGIDRANPRLSRGSGGPGQAPWVKTAQRRLAVHGFNVDPDGNFGASTDRQLTAFQKAHDLNTTGTVTPPTWAALRKDPPK